MQSSSSDHSGGGESSGDDQAMDDDEAKDAGDGSLEQAGSASLPGPKRKPNIFRGFRFERVCQVCELPGNTVKCRGCSSVFHRDCASNEGNESSDDGDAKAKKRRRSKKPEPKPRTPPKPVKKPRTAQDIYVTVVHDSDSDLDAADAEPQPTEDIDIMACILGEAVAEPQASIVVDVSSDEEEGDAGPGGVLAEMANRVKAAAAEDFRCMDCVVGRVPLCFSCGKATDPSGEDSNRYRCGTGNICSRNPFENTLNSVKDYWCTEIYPFISSAAKSLCVSVQ